MWKVEYISITRYLNHNFMEKEEVLQGGIDNSKMERGITSFKGCKILVLPPEIKFVLIHWVAFPTTSSVAGSRDDEKNCISSLNAIMLK